MPAIARQGDTVLSVDGSGFRCGSPMQTAVDQVNGNNVKANGILIVVSGNKIAAHPLSGCSVDGSTLSSFSSTVKIGGKGVGRIGDQFASMSSNIITQGSANVFAGG
jgi:uncharacterized Zn-binding protein involved in type VI secretion